MELGHRWRTVAYGAVIAVAVVGFKVTNDRADARLKESQRSACERGNITRSVLDGFILATVNARIKQDDPGVAVKFAAYHDQLVLAAADHPLALGSVQVDCATATE